MKSALPLIAAMSMFLFGARAMTDPVVVPDNLDTRTIQMLDFVIGNSDPGVCRKLAGKLSTMEIITAIYRGGRSTRLAALEVAGYVDHPWPILPYLVTLMTARERQTASRSAQAVLRSLQRVSSNPSGHADVIEGEFEQLVTELFKVADNRLLASDLRASALCGVAMINSMTERRYEPSQAHLEDKNVAVRAAAIGLLDPPLGDGILGTLAQIATSSNEIPMLRSQAVGLLCENALVHGVKAPSEDLAKIIRSLLSAELPAEAVLPILGCLRRFPPDARADLVDLALKHPDPAVGKFWESTENP